MMELSRLAYLYERYANGQCTEEERVEFMTLVSNDDSTIELNQLLDQDIQNSLVTNTLSASKADQLYSNILVEGKKRFNDKVIVKMFTFRKIAVAASVLFMLCSGSYLLFFKRTGNEVAINSSPAKQKYKNDVQPGGNKAVLTLADGSTIVLDSASTGTLTQQGGTKVIKMDNGQVAYNATGSQPTKVLYNTISTPRGGQYEVILQDGTKVWLNAESSLRFPTVFNGAERKVELTGEGYFEVAKNASMPFKVTSNDEEIEVLGTHFNIMAYSNEEYMKTTLLEGSVKVKKGEFIALLKPGEQGKSGNANTNIEVLKSDVSHEVAWKDGLFDFDNDNIRDIMNQLARWYDVEISYIGNVPSNHYTGSVRREANISQVLNILELAGGIQFSIEGKKIVITAK